MRIYRTPTCTCTPGHRLSSGKLCDFTLLSYPYQSQLRRNETLSSQLPTEAQAALASSSYQGTLWLPLTYSQCTTIVSLAKQRSVGLYTDQARNTQPSTGLNQKNSFRTASLILRPINGIVMLSFHSQLDLAHASGASSLR